MPVFLPFFRGLMLQACSYKGLISPYTPVNQAAHSRYPTGLRQAGGMWKSWASSHPRSAHNSLSASTSALSMRRGC